MTKRNFNWDYKPAHVLGRSSVTESRPETKDYTLNTRRSRHTHMMAHQHERHMHLKANPHLLRNFDA